MLSLARGLSANETTLIADMLLSLAKTGLALETDWELTPLEKA